MEPHEIPSHVFSDFRRYKSYVDLTADDERRVRRAGECIRGDFPAVIDDFYDAIRREPGAAAVITGGERQIAELKQSLIMWLDQFFTGPYDDSYVALRWRVGWRHANIGLHHIYTHCALSRLRSALALALDKNWPGEADALQTHVASLHRLLDFDLAIIQDAYHRELVAVQRLEASKRSEAAFQNLVESDDSLIVIVRQEGEIAYFNPFAQRITGYSAEEAVGQDFFRLLLLDEDRKPVRKGLRGVLSEGGEHRRQCRVLCRDGEHRFLAWNSQRIDDYKGAPAVVVIGQDITRQRQAEQRALQAERLAAVGEMIAGLAHESRNAFQRCQACLELLEIELDDQPEEIVLVGRIQKALDHLHHLYEEVRNYSAPIALEREVCDIAHIWRDVWEHLALTRRGKCVTLSEEIKTNNTKCSLDAFAIGQVIRNILENALSACPDPGTIVIRCEDGKIDDQPAIRLTISDNGEGVPPAVRPKIFDPFFTTKSKGTGLGMAIAKRIVEAHDGTIVLGESVKGATFEITFPRA